MYIIPLVEYHHPETGAVVLNQYEVYHISAIENVMAETGMDNLHCVWFMDGEVAMSWTLDDLDE